MKQSPLADLHRARGARMMERAGWQMPADYGSRRQEYAALQDGAGLIDLSPRGKFRITGRDRRTWLHGLVTQDVAGLPDGRGAYAAVLNPQGQMISDMRIFALPDALHCDVPAAATATVLEHLDRYLIMEHAEVQDLSEAWALISLQGEQAALVVRACFGTPWAELPPWGTEVREWEGIPLVVARVSHCGEDGFDFFVPAGHAASLYATLSGCAPQFAVLPVGWEALNQRRIEAGIPWWGHDLGPSVVPLAARLDAAISLTKGCYLGQEIIARIHARGQVNNLLTGMLVEGDRVPEAGEAVHAEGRSIGRVTSATRSPRLDRVVALGYLRREFTCDDQPVRIVAAEGEQAAAVAPLPFVPNDF